MYAVTLDDSTVTLRLAPSAPQPAGEWTTEDDGATWVRGHVEPSEALESETSPYPALVSLGVDDDGRDVLVDLEAAGGVVAIDGDPTVVSEVAASIALQSGTATWATDMRVTATGLPAGLAASGTTGSGSSPLSTTRSGRSSSGSRRSAPTCSPVG